MNRMLLLSALLAALGGCSSTLERENQAERGPMAVVDTEYVFTERLELKVGDKLNYFILASFPHKVARIVCAVKKGFGHIEVSEGRKFDTSYKRENIKTFAFTNKHQCKDAIRFQEDVKPGAPLLIRFDSASKKVSELRF